MACEELGVLLQVNYERLGAHSEDFSFIAPSGKDLDSLAFSKTMHLYVLSHPACGILFWQAGQQWKGMAIIQYRFNHLGFHRHKEDVIITSSSSPSTSVQITDYVV